MKWNRNQLVLSREYINFRKSETGYANDRENGTLAGDTNEMEQKTTSPKA